MHKKVITILAICTVILLTVLCAGCTDNQSNNNSDSTNTPVIKSYIEEYQGTWKVNDNGNDMTLKINSDGTGTLEINYTSGKYIKDDLKVGNATNGVNLIITHKYIKDNGNVTLDTNALETLADCTVNGNSMTFTMKKSGNSVVLTKS